MRKVKIRLPATITNPGPGVSGMALALSLYTTVEIFERSDDKLVVETSGEGAGHYSVGLRHPIVLGMIRLFQRLERAPLGIQINVDNRIPITAGLGAEAAFFLAGAIGANNLLGSPFTRTQVLEIAARAAGSPESVVAAIFGGLATGVMNGDELIHHPLKLAAMQIIIVLPELEHYAERTKAAMPEKVLLRDALHNLSRIPLLIAALQEGNLELLRQVMDDRLRVPFLTSHIPGYDHVLEMARRSGAQAISLSGNGPALMIFAKKDHDELAQTIKTAFENVGVKARSWVLPVDTQGVVISASGSM
ncbi:MAG: hypothetical protein H7175_04050 [Burkholderiales bacterium]|nr:hypothetical protein [Anaerolineae bacterium]